MKNDQLEELYIKYHRELYLYAFSLCRDHHLSQDLTSETFFKAVLSINNNNIQYIKYWLFKVCKNLFLDYIRKDKKHRNTRVLENTLAIEETPLDKIINNEERRFLYNEIVNLRSTYKEILILYYYCDFTLNEISQTAGMTPGAAKTLLFRARKKLKTVLEGNNEI